MPSKLQRFTDDGWAIWIDGDDKSTIYLNDWMNPKGKNYIDIGIRIYGVGRSSDATVFIPFPIEEKEVQDLSFLLANPSVLRGIFNTHSMDAIKITPYISVLNYEKRTFNLLHLNPDILDFHNVAYGTILTIQLKAVQNQLTSNELYILFRIPHKSLDNLFASRLDVNRSINRLKERISSPLEIRKYGYSIRINEARLLPPEINAIETLHEQHLRKALVAISLDEAYELNDSNCYRIRRLEPDLYYDYAPTGYNCNNAITYQWVEERPVSVKAHYNFYFAITHSSINKKSLSVYLLVVLLTAVCGNAICALVSYFAAWLIHLL